MPLKSSKKQPKRRSPKNSHSQALILIDGTAIRKKAKRAFEKVRRDLDKARFEVERFHSQDTPEFQKWFNSTFGSLITEIRETGQRLAERRQLIYEVEYESYYQGISCREAYLRVMERRKNPPEPCSENNKEFDESPYSDGFEPFESNTDFDEESEAEWNEAHKNFNSLFEEMFGFSPTDGDQPRSNSLSTPEPAMIRVKNLYRAIVRRLHPDVQSEMSSQKLEWWHQAQEAYGNQDGEQLEMILTLCEIQDSGATTHASVSVLTRITKQFRSTLRSIKRDISNFRQDPAWSFSQKSSTDRLHKRIRADLDDELFDLREFLAAIDSKIAQWVKAPAPRKRSTRRKPPVSQHQEFIF